MILAHEKSVVQEHSPFLEMTQGMDMVINCAGVKVETDKRVCLDFELIKYLVDACTESGCRRFILVTSMYVTRPKSTAAYFLNNMVGNVLGCKLAGENYLRESGINYTIIRPGQLNGEHDANVNATLKPQCLEVMQGDKGSGYS